MGKPLKKKIDGVEVLEKESNTSFDQKSTKGRFKLCSSEESELDIIHSEEFKDFILKSEYVERDVNLKKPTEEELSQPVSTNVKVYRGKEVQNVDIDELKDLIKTAKDIKQVVVEQLSVKEATRVSMLFEPNRDKVGERYNKFLSGAENKKPENLEYESTSIDKTDDVDELISLEKKLNASFIQRENYQTQKEAEQIEQNQKLIVEREKEKEKKIDIERSRAEIELERRKQEENQKVDELFSELSETEDTSSQGTPISQEKEIDFDNEVFQENLGKNKFKFKSNVEVPSLKTGEVSDSEPHSKELVSEDDEDLELKRVAFSKQTLTRKKGKVHNGFYYRAKDHVELFKMGSSYLRDFKDGIKSFAFSCVGLTSDREKTVFGVSAFFNYHSDVNMVIVTENFDSSFYSNFVGKFDVERREVPEEDLSYKVYVAKGFEVIELTELGKIERKIRNYDFEDFLDHLVDSYDLILWDLPEIETLNSFKELYFPVIRTLDNVSFIVGQNKSMMDDVTKMIEYFKRYQVTIKGLLFAPDRTSKKKKKEAA